MSARPDDVSLAKNIGGAVRVARKRARLSQEALAALSGVSTQAVSQIENGENLPKLQTLARIAQALGTRIHELLGDGDRTPETFEAEMLAAVRALDRADRLVALAVVRAIERSRKGADLRRPPGRPR